MNFKNVKNIDELIKKAEEFDEFLPEVFEVGENQVQKSKGSDINKVTLELFDGFMTSPKFNRIKDTKNPNEIFDIAAMMTHAAIHEKFEELGKLEKNPDILIISEYHEYFDELKKEDPTRYDKEKREFTQNPPEDYLQAKERLEMNQSNMSNEQVFFNKIQDILERGRKQLVLDEFAKNKRIPYRFNPRMIEQM
jgi:hypothetical protein